MMLLRLNCGLYANGGDILNANAWICLFGFLIFVVNYIARNGLIDSILGIMIGYWDNAVSLISTASLLLILMH